MKNRQLFYLQIFTIAPLILFLLLYTNHVWLVVLLSVLLVCSISKYRKDGTFFKLPLVAVLTATFWVYAFIGLGNQDAPQTFKSLTPKDSFVTFQFDKVTKIDEMCYYVGIDKITTNQTWLV